MSVITLERSAATIAPLSQAELGERERAEVARLCDLLESLAPEEWMRPTRTPQRTVLAVAAHVAGSYAAQGSLRQLSRQFDPRVHQLYRSPGQRLAETLVQVQIGDRLNRHPEELIAEIRASGERAISFRTSVLRPLQRVSTERISRPRRFPGNWKPVTPLLDLWKHRLEIALATNRSFDVSLEHDGRIFEHHFVSAVKFTTDELRGRSVSLAIAEFDGFRYRFGEEGEAVGQIVIPAIVLARLMCGWHSAAAARERSNVAGDVKAVMTVLRAIAASNN